MCLNYNLKENAFKFKIIFSLAHNFPIIEFFFFKRKRKVEVCTRIRIQNNSIELSSIQFVLRSSYCLHFPQTDFQFPAHETFSLGMSLIYLLKMAEMKFSFAGCFFVGLKERGRIAKTSYVISHTLKLAGLIFYTNSQVKLCKIN